jgi:glyoxylase-like metal-dependent hydrolase (beta-lactamase superfamily II)
MVCEVHATSGHDPQSADLFAPHERLRFSRDALWENVFGVRFPDIEGVRSFDDVRDTLNLTGTLEPKVVFPGHGPIFPNLSPTLDIAR